MFPTLFFFLSSSSPSSFSGSIILSASIQHRRIVYLSSAHKVRLKKISRIQRKCTKMLYRFGPDELLQWVQAAFSQVLQYSNEVECLIMVDQSFSYKVPVVVCKNVGDFCVNSGLKNELQLVRIRTKLFKIPFLVLYIY